MRCGTPLSGEAHGSRRTCLAGRHKPVLFEMFHPRGSRIGWSCGRRSRFCEGLGRWEQGERDVRTCVAFHGSELSVVVWQSRCSFHSSARASTRPEAGIIRSLSAASAAGRQRGQSGAITSTSLVQVRTTIAVPVAPTRPITSPAATRWLVPSPGTALGARKTIVVPYRFRHATISRASH